MNLPDELLMQYVDGELASEASLAVEAALAKDGTAARRVAALRAQRDLLQRAFAEQLDEPVPGRLLRAASTLPAAGSPSVAYIGRKEPRRTATSRVRGWGWPEWSAMAASLMLGLGITQMAPQHHAAEISAGVDGLVASRPLASVLDDTLANRQAPEAAVQVGLSFENTAGRICRTFHARSAGGWSGLACNVDGEWRLSMIVEDPRTSTPSDALRAAASPTPPALLRAIDDQIRGEPLDAAGERAAQARGWRR